MGSKLFEAFASDETPSRESPAGPGGVPRGAGQQRGAVPAVAMGGGMTSPSQLAVGSPKSWAEEEHNLEVPLPPQPRATMKAGTASAGKPQPPPAAAAAPTAVAPAQRPTSKPSHEDAAALNRQRWEDFLARFFPQLTASNFFLIDFYATARANWKEFDTAFVSKVCSKQTRQSLWETLQREVAPKAREVQQQAVADRTAAAAAPRPGTQQQQQQVSAAPQQQQMSTAQQSPQYGGVQLSASGVPAPRSHQAGQQQQQQQHPMASTSQPQQQTQGGLSIPAMRSQQQQQQQQSVGNKSATSPASAPSVAIGMNIALPRSQQQQQQPTAPSMSATQLTAPQTTSPPPAPPAPAAPTVKVYDMMEFTFDAPAPTMPQQSASSVSIPSADSGGSPASNKGGRQSSRHDPNATKPTDRRRQPQQPSDRGTGSGGYQLSDARFDDEWPTEDYQAQPRSGRQPTNGPTSGVTGRQQPNVLPMGRSATAAASGGAMGVASVSNASSSGASHRGLAVPSSGAPPRRNRVADTYEGASSYHDQDNSQQQDDGQDGDERFENTICRYFNTQGGCRRGDSCKYLHESTGGQVSMGGSNGAAVGARHAPGGGSRLGPGSSRGSMTNGSRQRREGGVSYEEDGTSGSFSSAPHEESASHTRRPRRGGPREE